MHVHFIAVAGTGMGALAGLFKAKRHDASGSHLAFYPPIGPALERWVTRLLTGFDPPHLDPRPVVVLGGGHATTILETAPKWRPYRPAVAPVPTLGPDRIDTSPGGAWSRAGFRDFAGGRAVDGRLVAGAGGAARVGVATARGRAE